MEYISREDALKSICEYCSEKGMCADANVHCAEYADIKAVPAADVISKQAVLDALEREREYLLANGMNGAEHILVHHAINVIKDL